MTFAYAEVWTDVGCAAGAVREAQIPSDKLVRLVATEALDVPETGQLVVLSDWEFLNVLEKGKVIRICTTDPAVYRELRVSDIEETYGDGPQQTVVSLDPIVADLNRAFYHTYDAEGVAVHEYLAEGATPEDVLTDAVLPALAEAGLDWIAVDTVEPTDPLDIETADGDNAQAIVQQVCDLAGAERDLVRHSDTHYGLQLRTAIGADAPPVRARTRINLQRWKRRYHHHRAYNRIRPRGGAGETSRDCSWAYWLIVAKNTTGAHYLDVSDPRGGTYRGPARFPDQFNGHYLAELGPTFGSSLITDTEVISATVTRLYIADVSGYTVGRYTEFRVASGASGGRVFALDHPATQALHGGVYAAVLDRDQLSGAVNYFPNAWLGSWADTVTFTTATSDGTKTYSTGSPTVTRAGGVSFLEYVAVGDILLRPSDDAVIGTVQAVASTTVTLTANAGVSDSTAQFKITRVLPTGWTVTPGGVSSRFTWTRETDGTTFGPDVWAWSTGGLVAGVVLLRSPTLTPDKARPWRFWVWLDVTMPATSGVFHVTLRRADTNAQVAGTETVTVPDSHSGRLLVEFLAPDISASATGVYVRIEAGTNASSTTTEFTVLAGGVAPASWTLLDVGEPKACDLWHAANDALERVPVAYELEVLDLALLEGEFVKGGQVDLEDTDLGERVSLRARAIHRDYLDPSVTRLELGEREETYDELLARRTARHAGAGRLARRLANGLLVAIRNAALDDTLPALQIAVKDSDGVLTGHTADVGTNTLAEALVLPLTRAFPRR